MKRPNGLPEWFNLENYKDAELLSPFEWHENLYIRKMFYVYLESAKNGWANGGEKDAMGRCKEIIEVITTKPVLRKSNEKKWYSSKANTVDFLSNNTLIQDYKLLAERAPSCFSEVMRLENQIKHQDQKITDFIDANELSALAEYLYRPFSPSRGSEARITVNLLATDEHLMSDFKEWLANVRKNSYYKITKKPFSLTDFKEWAEFKILPYLDLKIWSEFTDCQITQTIIGNAIFPDEFKVDTTERIRRTTKKKAEWLMDSLLLDALDAQIQKEHKFNKAT